MRTLAVLVVAWLVLGLCPTAEPARALQADDEDGGVDAKPGAANLHYRGPACMKVHAYARYGAGAYDHIVSFESACDKLAHCEVSTDVNSDVTEVEIEAGETRDVVTFRGSPAYEFTATVRCHF